MRSFIYFISILLSFSIPTYSQGDRKKNNADIEKLKIEIKTSSEAAWKEREMNADSVITILFSNLSIAEEYELQENIAQISNFIGAMYCHYLYQVKKAPPFFHKALKNSLFTNDSIQLGYAYNNLSYVYTTIGNTTLALQYAQNTIEIFSELEFDVGIAYGFTSLGIIYRQKKEFEKSLEYFRKATQIRKKFSPLARQGSALYNVAKTHEMAGNLDSAKILYTEALNQEDASEKTRYGASCLTGLGNINYFNNNFKTALQYFEEALENNRQRYDIYAYLDNYLGMGLVFAKLGRFDEAEMYLQRALKLSKNMGMDAHIILAYKAFINIYEIKGDLNKVKESSDIFISQYDSILNSQENEIILELERKYTIQEELIRTSEELATNKQLKNRLVIIILLMIAIIMVLIWLFFYNRTMNRRLEESNEAKDKLFSVISHDLKNPFNSLVGLSQELNKKLDNGDIRKAKEYAGYLTKASNEGLILLTNLLHWSMSQSGKIEFKPGIFNFDVFFNKLAKQFEIEVGKHNIKLSFENHIKQDISADSDILTIIMTNLITNAIKYTSEGGTIKVIATSHGKQARIQVIDSGIGISNETLNGFFNKRKFIESQSGVRKEKGTGLGLNIIHDLLQLHKGDISVSSEIGVGSTFMISFPI